MLSNYKSPQIQNTNNVFTNKEQLNNSKLSDYSKDFNLINTSSPFSNILENNHIYDKIKPNLVDITKFSKIPEQDLNFFKNNTNKINIKALEITYKNNNFIFKSNDDKLSGKIDFKQILQYVANDPDKNFLSKYENNNWLIERFFVKNHGNNNLKIIDYNESQFTGDLEMVMQLINLIEEFIKTELTKELEYVKTNHKQKIENNIKLFYILMLNYTIKLISITSQTLKISDDKIKNNLLKYSVIIVLKICKYVQKEIKSVIEKNKKIEDMLLINAKLKLIIVKKFDELLNKPIQTISKQFSENEDEFQIFNITDSIGSTNSTESINSSDDEDIEIEKMDYLTSFQPDTGDVIEFYS